MSVRLADHPRLLWALSAQRPVRESAPILARQALASARRHPAGVEATAWAIGTALGVLVAYAGALSLVRSMETT